MRTTTKKFAFILFLQNFCTISHLTTGLYYKHMNITRHTKLNWRSRQVLQEL